MKLSHLSRRQAMSNFCKGSGQRRPCASKSARAGAQLPGLRLACSWAPCWVPLALLRELAALSEGISGELCDYTSAQIPPRIFLAAGDSLLGDMCLEAQRLAPTNTGNRRGAARRQLAESTLRVKPCADLGSAHLPVWLYTHIRYLAIYSVVTKRPTRGR